MEGHVIKSSALTESMVEKLAVEFLDGENWKNLIQPEKPEIKEED